MNDDQHNIVKRRKPYLTSYNHAISKFKIMVRKEHRMPSQKVPNNYKLRLLANFKM